MSESFITVSTAYVVKLAKERLAQVQKQAQIEFDLHVAHLVKEANAKIALQHRKVEVREKSFFKFLMPKNWLERFPKHTVENVREQILTEFKNVDHPAYRLEFDSPHLLASIVDDPSETWPTLWELANINVSGIKHGNKINDIEDTEVIMQLSITHARLIGLIF